MDPLRWQQAVNTYAKSLAALDPAIAAAVSVNATRYSDRLTQLDAEIKQNVAKLAPELRLLATTHDALGYWAERYDFKVVATIIPGASTTAGAANPRNIKAVVDGLRAAKVKVLFAEEGVNPKLTEAVAGEAGIVVIETLYLDTLSNTSGPAATYIDMMRHNARTIVGALK
jgi:ABC-type Zn uptake system ZnuABC Zn-binding protein ZnuA